MLTCFDMFLDLHGPKNGSQSCLYVQNATEHIRVRNYSLAPSNMLTRNLSLRAAPDGIRLNQQDILAQCILRGTDSGNTNLGSTVHTS
jgi:hypothetical protein